MRVTVRYSGDEEITSGITMSVRIRGRPRIKDITLNDEKADYYAKCDECSTYVFVDLETVAKDDVLELVARF
ncbi:MAG: hypothetical protein JRI71_10815 [Deltaproteobacteria bacterium]|nr:hypothetical protein [Deltaproteobacteria bacterium]